MLQSGTCVWFYNSATSAASENALISHNNTLFCEQNSTEDLSSQTLQKCPFSGIKKPLGLITIKIVTTTSYHHMAKKGTWLPTCMNHIQKPSVFFYLFWPQDLHTYHIPKYSMRYAEPIPQLTCNTKSRSNSMEYSPVKFHESHSVPLGPASLH